MHQEYEMPPLQPRRRLEIDRVPMSQAEGVKRISLPVASETTLDPWAATQNNRSL